jgi:hypothetical protein
MKQKWNAVLCLLQGFRVQERSTQMF